ncbi:MAG: transposase family protein [Actinomycetota bacterium]
MLGLPGFRVLDAQESDAELVVVVESLPEPVGCPGCGVVAVAHDRMPVESRDLPAFGRAVRLVWSKHRWRCEEPLCGSCTWTETSPLLSSRCLLTRRAGLECCLQVGVNARPVAQIGVASVSWTSDDWGRWPRIGGPQCREPVPPIRWSSAGRPCG